MTRAPSGALFLFKPRKAGSENSFPGIAFAVLLIAWILYLIFGQITVRKLERDAEVKARLGFEVISGWWIFNVAEALVLPESF